MPSQLQNELQALARPPALQTLTRIRRGIEKESLRITPEGKLAQTPHPGELGSALTHRSITTDYSEALLEFITPVSTSITGSLRVLEDIHSFVYRQLDGELLWAASMPCIVAGDAGIPVARYGNANVARMKTVYRYGLGHRYGRLMQTIAGIHYNWSMPGDYWDSAWRQAGSPGELDTYITERYLGLIRNFRRYSWLLIYLFGASPALCSSFLAGRDHHGLEPFDDSGRSFHRPDGTSLRMGDLGYNSAAQSNLNICYNSLENYVQTLRSAILQPHPGYAHIPCGQNGNYQQLSDSLLQIENEFYSPIRPKRVTNPGETALNALVRGGIEYIEVRCVDVSPFSPVGLDEQQVHFLDTFLLYCLLKDSPLCDDTQQAAQDANLEAVVNRGRQPDLMLDRNGDPVSLPAWAQELLDGMEAVAALYDRAFDVDHYAASLKAQAAKITDPQLTPSARILREMRERDMPFFRLAMAYSEHWAEYFCKRPPAADTEAALNEEAARSLAAQKAIEAADTLSFEEHLARYFAVQGAPVAAVNFLAHFHLAWPDSGLLAGGLEGDYYKGPLRGDLPPDLERGVRLHRAIDAYTDAHPCIDALRRTLPAGLRRYAGILIDLGFDHCLSRHWSRFCAVPLPVFNATVYRSLRVREADLSKASRRMLDRLTRHDLLGRYGEWPTVTASAARIGQRFSRGNPFVGIDPQLAFLRRELDQSFLVFYPQLQAYCAAYARQL